MIEKVIKVSVIMEEELMEEKPIKKKEKKKVEKEEKKQRKAEKKQVKAEKKQEKQDEHLKKKAKKLAKKIERKQEIIEKNTPKKEEKKEKKKDVIEEEELSKKKTKKKVHLKKKAIIIPIFLGIILILGIIGLLGFNSFKNETIKNIKKLYSTHVIITKDTNLYNKKNKVIGTISKDQELDLESLKIFTYKNRYLKVKGSSYYVYYKDIKKKKETTKEEDNTSYYLPLEKSIRTNKKVSLMNDKKTVITLNNGIESPIQKMDEEYYYVEFFNQLLKIKKSKDIKETESKSDIKKADHVSAIYYELIDDNCGEDACLKTASVKAHIEHMKDAGYYFIPKEDYISFLNGYVNLKENAVFMTTNNINENVNNIIETTKVPIGKIEESDKITLSMTNKTSTKNDDKQAVNAYQAKKYTVIDNYVRMAAGEDVPDNGKETPNNQGIAVINYHFFYDQTIPGESQACNESICLEREKLKSHLQWLKDNNYKTLTIKEFADWYDGIIEVPEKSVLLTIDDGAHGTGAHNGNVLIPLLEEYQEHATLFLIAGWWDIENYRSDYLDIQSHSYNLHYEATCADGRGKVACSDYQTVKNDLQQSLDVIQDNTSFCFPFYSSDRESIQAIQELGFRVSFVGGSTKARRSNNRYLIPRYPIMDDVTLNEFINMVS